ncbi:MAG: c-type cytochrome [Steroidobacteraceae bacterium]
MPRKPAARSRSRLAFMSLAILMSASALAYEPRINYMLQCQGCHGPDGRGEPGHVPSIRTTLAPLSRFAAGRRYLLQVPGVALSALSDQDLAALLNWMIPAFGGVKPRQFRAYTAAEVARYRREPLVEISATRARLMRQLQLRQ